MVNQHSYEKSPLFISINGSCFKARLGYQGGCPLMPIQNVSEKRHPQASQARSCNIRFCGWSLMTRKSCLPTLPRCVRKGAHFGSNSQYKQRPKMSQAYLNMQT